MRLTVHQTLQKKTISELEDIEINTIQHETQQIQTAKKKKERKERNEQSLSQLWNKFKWHYIHVIEIPKNRLGDRKKSEEITVIIGEKEGR